MGGSETEYTCSSGKSSQGNIEGKTQQEGNCRKRAEKTEGRASKKKQKEEAARKKQQKETVEKDSGKGQKERVRNIRTCIFASEHAFALKNLLALLGSKGPRQVTSNFWEAQKLNIHVHQGRVRKETKKEKYSRKEIAGKGQKEDTEGRDSTKETAEGNSGKGQREGTEGKRSQGNIEGKS